MKRNSPRTAPTPSELAAAAALSARLDEALCAVRAHPYGLAARLLRTLALRPLYAVNAAGERLERRLYAAARRRLAARFPDLARSAPWW